MNSAARTAKLAENAMGLCWGSDKFVLQFSYVRIYKRVILQLVFDCSDDVHCVRLCCNASYDDVGRSPEHLNQSRRRLELKNISLCRSTRLRCPRRYFCHLHPQKNPQGFCFQVKVLVLKRPPKRNKPYFFECVFSKMLFYQFMIFLHVEPHHTRLLIDRVLFCGEVTPSA